MSERLTVRYVDSHVEIRYRWFEASFVNSVIIPIALLLIPIGLGRAATGTEGSGWFAFATFVVIWAGCTYCYLAKLLNTTVIRTDQDSLSVSHSPIPWAPSPTLKLAEIEKVFARDRFHSQVESGAETGSFTAEVVVRVSGTEKIIVRRLSDFHYAQTIAECLRKSLDTDSQMQ